MHRDEILPWHMALRQPWKQALEKHVARSHQKALAHGMSSDVTLLEHIKVLANTILLSQRHVKPTRLFCSCQVFYSPGQFVPIELSIATIFSNGSDPKVMGITMNRAGITSTQKILQSNSHENERLRLVHQPLPKSVPVEYLPFCVRGKLRRGGLDRGGLMVVKRTEQQKIFQELGVFAMSLETLPEFKDIYDGIFQNSMHEDAHEDVSYCTMVKSYQFAQFLQQFNKLQAEWSHEVSLL
ncbi:hypothetical protein TNCV_2995181 [Trichonephila clavipes]|nr:hypothetical protein TNCV_2995181 [Trichonephila clavipes]